MYCTTTDRSDEEKRRDVYASAGDARGVSCRWLHGSRWECSGEWICVHLWLDRLHDQTHDPLEHRRHAKLEQLLAGRPRLALHGIVHWCSTRVYFKLNKVINWVACSTPKPAPSYSHPPSTGNYTKYTPNTNEIWQYDSYRGVVSYLTWILQ